MIHVVSQHSFPDHIQTWCFWGRGKKVLPFVSSKRDNTNKHSPPTGITWHTHWTMYFQLLTLIQLKTCPVRRKSLICCGSCPMGFLCTTLGRDWARIYCFAQHSHLTVTPSVRSATSLGLRRSSRWPDTGTGSWERELPFLTAAAAAVMEPCSQLRELTSMKT